MPLIGERGVVLGASMGGLLAARVLSDFYQQVTVVERDRLPETSENRRGVPQGRHVHALLSGGARVIDELFPRLLDDLVASGAPKLENLSDFHFCPGGHVLCRDDHPVSVACYQATRPHLERHVRDRLRAISNVEVLDGCDVVGLATSGESERVVTGLASRGAATRRRRTSLRPTWWSTRPAAVAGRQPGCEPWGIRRRWRSSSRST